MFIRVHPWFLLLCCLAGPAAAQAQATPEVRGTWLTTTGVDHIRTGANTESVFNTLRDTGLNTAYIEALKAGYSQFPSATLQAFTGWNRHPNLGPVRDLIDETVIQAHRNNMAAVAWFEYGFAASFAGANTTFASGPLANAANQRGWLLKDQNGQFTNSQTSFQWMNPAVPEVRQLLIDVVVEAVTQYDLDGIQFDDRLAWPTTLGYDSTTRAIVNQRAGFNVPVGSSTYNNWLGIVRNEALDAFVAELHSAVRAVDPDVWIGLAPSVNGFSQQNLTADWPKWVQQGYFDEVVPQVYRSSLSSFNASLPSNVSPFTSTNREDLAVMGLRFNGSGSDTPLNDVLGMIQATRNAANGELAGHSIWYSDNVVDFAAQLEAFYDASGGWTPNPRLEPGQRPDPVVAAADPLTANAWNVTVTNEGMYRVVAPVFAQGQWKTLDTIYLRPGQHTLTAAAALGQLELLADRRPLAFDINDDGLLAALDADAFYAALIDGQADADLNGDGVFDTSDLAAFALMADTVPGDLDFDGDLDLDDAAALVAAYGQTVAPLAGIRGWTSGDLDLNGTIDFADAMAFLQHARAADLSPADFAAITNTLTTIPEPAMALAWLAGLSFVRPARKAANLRR